MIFKKMLRFIGYPSSQWSSALEPVLRELSFAHSIIFPRNFFSAEIVLIFFKILFKLSADIMTALW